MGHWTDARASLTEPAAYLRVVGLLSSGAATLTAYVSSQS